MRKKTSDDGSTEPLEEIISIFQKRISVHLLKQKKQGPAVARNYGATIVKGEYLVFTNDDCRLDTE